MDGHSLASQRERRSHLFYLLFTGKNTTQNTNRRRVNKRKLALTLFFPPQSDLKILIDAQSDSSTLVHTVVISGDSNITFLYAEKKLKGMELFGFMTITIFHRFWAKILPLWITKTSYHNKQLLNSRTSRNAVNLGPVMMHFTKFEEGSRMFYVELSSANPQPINLKNVGVGMEVSIFTGFQSVISNFLQLYCVRYLQQRDEKIIDSCDPKSGVVLKLTT